MSAWAIRAATRGDAAIIVNLEARAFGPASWGATAVSDGLTAPHVHALLACPPSATPASGFAFWRAVGEEAEILSIGVAPAARRSGAARALLAAIIDRARAVGVRRLFLEVDVGNAAAVALYESFAFERIGKRKRYYRNGGDALVMRLDL